MDIGFDDMMLDDTMGGLEQEEKMFTSVNEDIISFGSKSLGDDTELPSHISFGSHIDDLYDSSIKTAQENLIHHLTEAANAQTVDDMKFHLDHAKESRDSEDFWQDAKHDAELESRKDEIFIDGINKQWEIMDKYQKEIDNIFKR